MAHIELSGDAGSWFEEIDHDEDNNPIWRVRGTDIVLRGGILDFYRQFGGMNENGLTFLGLPKTNELVVSTNPLLVLQVFECGVVAFDPEHVIDNRPGAPGTYLVRLDAPILAEVAHMVYPELLDSEPVVTAPSNGSSNGLPDGKKKQRGRPRKDTTA